MEWLGSPRSLPRPLLISGLASFFAFLSFNLLATALPLYFVRVLGFGLAEVGLVVGIKYLFNFFAYVLVGRAVDRAGATVYVVGSALALASAAPLFGLFESVLILGAVSVWQGVTMSAFVVANAAVAGGSSDPARRGAQLAVYGLFSNVAIAVGPALGGILFNASGPGTLFVASSLAALAAAGLGTMLPRRRPVQRAVSERASRRAGGWLRGARPLLFPAGAMVAYGTGFGVLLAFMPEHLASRGVANPGIFFSAELPALLLLRVYAGALSDRYGRPAVAGVGVLLSGLGVLAMYTISTNLGVILAGLISGAGAALFVPVVFAWMFDVVPEGRHGLASAVNYLAMDAGRAAGAIGLGFVATGTLATAPFGISGALAVLAGLALLATWGLPGNEGRIS